MNASRAGASGHDAAPLELAAVTVRYGGHDGVAAVTVFEELELVVGAGEFVCLAGRSGSGKTTLLHVAAGLLDPSAGEVRWDGDAIGRLSDAARAKRRRTGLGIVFQSGGLIGSLTAAENVALPGLPATAQTTGQERAREVLAEVGLEARRGHFPSQLSAGEQQRVALARALFADPPTLLVDEPTANLDRASATVVIDLLAQLHRSGRTVVVASHDEALISRATRVVRLD